MKQMRSSSRVIIALASISLSLTCFVPFWFIFLKAPQYPEGLTMKIWLRKLSGDVDIINGLNHYIGMKHIKEAMFPEFHFLTYAVLSLVLAGLLVAITGKRQLLFSYLLLLAGAGVAALVDFYNWGYNYGHNLDPKAPIQVPGLSYQPPLIGHKALLNFDAYSYPDLGGWITVSAASMLFLVWLFEFRRNRSHKKTASLTKSPTPRVAAKTMAAAVIALLFLSSCSNKPEPFALGKDNCSFCKMTIVSSSFGGEILTRKGRIFKFDDMHCLLSFLKSGEISKETIQEVVAINYQAPHQFLDVSKAIFIKNSSFNSPMNGNIAAFPDVAAAHDSGHAQGNETNWDHLSQSLQ